MLLQDHCEAVLHAATRDEFQRVLVRFAQDLGFGIMAAAAVYDHPGSRVEFVTAHNTPQPYLDIFESTAGAHDPVMQHCKFSGLPIVWNQSTYVRAGRGELWEEMAAHGYQTGISMALHLPHGRHFMFGVDGDRRLPKQQKELARMVADLASVLMFARESAFRLLRSAGGDVCHELQRPMLIEPPALSICVPGENRQPLSSSLHGQLPMNLDHRVEKSTEGLSSLKTRFRKLIH